MYYSLSLLNFQSFLFLEFLHSIAFLSFNFRNFSLKIMNLELLLCGLVNFIFICKIFIPSSSAAFFTFEYFFQMLFIYLIFPQIQDHYQVIKVVRIALQHLINPLKMLIFIIKLNAFVDKEINFLKFTDHFHPLKLTESMMPLYYQINKL